MKRFWKHATGAFSVALVWTAGTVVQAAFIGAGAFQTEQGDPADWDPPNTSVVFVESPPASGIYSYTLSNLGSGVLYEFKIIDGANWGDPEVTPQNAWVVGDASGEATIQIDTNVLINNGNYPFYQVGIDGAAWTPQVVGSFMDEAGGAGDWNPQDPAFDMSDSGGGEFTYSGVISTPGTYQIKISDGAVGWARQFGPDGFNGNAGVFEFTSTAPNQELRVSFTPATGAFSLVIPEPMGVSLLGVALMGFAGLRRR